ncbi:ribosomal protein S5 domain 2-type protein, partial [Amanita rubescens]
MAAERPVPVYTDLKELYSNLGTSLDHITRWDNLTKEFENRFGKKPAYIARAPGRVKSWLTPISGEHIDYSLFGVLPAAIERDILIACAPRDIVAHPWHTELETHHSPGHVIAENLDAKYPPQVFAPAPKHVEPLDVGEDLVRVQGWGLDINTKELRWESYVKAGYYGVLDHSFPPGTHEHPVPVDLLVTGTVPAGSGLSSSAAMVVASSLAFLAVNGKLDHHVPGFASPIRKLSKGELVRMAMENEKRVGVNSGGMDQAASVISDPSSALYISFYPTLAAFPVPLPPKSVFVCANSLVISDKAVTAKHRYNLRVVETLVGARILAKELGIPITDTEKITFREVVGRFAGEEDETGELSIEELQEALEIVITKLDVLKPHRDDGLTMEEMINMSGLAQPVFDDVYLSWVDIEATHFQLYNRAKHVLSESLRVLQFRKICLDAFTCPETGSGVLESLGNLMNDSQRSCSSLFDCSCPELDTLVSLSIQAGAFGSRLTGAGWGGCTVSLVAEDKVEEFIEKVSKTYEPYRGLEGEELNQVIFATKPSSGAC